MLSTPRCYKRLLIARFHLLSLIVVVYAGPNPFPRTSYASEGDTPPAHRERLQRIEAGLVGKDAAKPPQKLEERMRELKVPGVSVAVIDGGKIAWSKGYGVVQDGGTEAVTPGTLFQAASISKPITALAALRLVERGVLNLDEDVNVKLKSWKVPDSEHTAAKKVTLRGLLSHSAGTTVHGFSGYAAGKPVPTLVQLLNGEKPANSGAIRAQAEPGTKMKYSGGGYCIVQQLLMDVTGKPFPDFMRNEVLVPLGMKDSTYEQPLPSALESRAAIAHNAAGRASPSRWHTYPEMAAAGLWTTPTDLARFVIAVQEARARKPQAVLSPALAQQMLTVQVTDCGLGLMIESRGAVTRFSHGGSNMGFQCFLIGDTAGHGAVVMTNADQGGTLASELIRAIAKEYGWK